MPRPASDSNLSASGARIGGNANQGSASGSSNRRGGGGNGGGYSAGGASGRYNSRSQLAQKNPITSDALDRVRDYEDVDNGFFDNVGNMLAGAFGFNEMDPTITSREALMAGRRPGQHADWGYDPAGTIGSLAGMALGIPGMGLLADQISRFAGRPLEVNLGPSVIGAPDAPATPAAPAAPAATQSGALPPGMQQLAARNPDLFRRVMSHLAMTATPAPAGLTPNLT